MLTATPKFAVLTGSIADGFSIALIEDTPQAAEAAVVNALADGKLAEWLEVQAPMAAGQDVSSEGNIYLALDNGFGEGMTLYGSFEHAEDAEKFGTDECDDNDWSIWIARAPASPREMPRG